MSNQRYSILMIFAAKHGGFAVKNHDTYNNQTEILFAGDINSCLSFIKSAMMEAPNE